MTKAVEIELKFQVPRVERDRLRRAVATTTAAAVHLRAAYFDTVDDRLAAAGLALRLRQEGLRWVQTLKGRGDGLMQRLEHEVVLPPQRGRPVLDPARHAGAGGAAGAALAALLADGAALEERYRTDVRRLQRRVKSGGATIEIAFDEGRIVAAGRSLPVCEIEFELLSGPPAALPAYAERWVARHALWLDVRTKSERGHRLARALDHVAATKAAPAWLPPQPTPAVVFAASLHAALMQLLPNAAELAGGVPGRPGQAEHLHQMRVAIRRLRTALRLFGGWSSDPAAAQALELRWRAVFQRLGAARDADVLAALPGQASPGALPAAPAAEPPGAVAREPAFGALMLQTLQRALAPGPALEAPLAPAVQSVFKRAWKRLVADAAVFDDAEPEAQHRTRKRLKRLRYASEFLLPLLPPKRTRNALAAMRAVLEALGAYNDVLVAEARCREGDPDDPRVAYALGWLAAQRVHLRQRAARRLQRLAAQPRFWR